MNGERLEADALALRELYNHLSFRVLGPGKDLTEAVDVAARGLDCARRLFEAVAAAERSEG
jgi:hypothetical protein